MHSKNLPATPPNIPKSTPNTSSQYLPSYTQTTKTHIADMCISAVHLRPSTPPFTPKLNTEAVDDDLWLRMESRAQKRTTPHRQCTLRISEYHRKCWHRGTFTTSKHTCHKDIKHSQTCTPIGETDRITEVLQIDLDSLASFLVQIDRPVEIG